jgi:protein-disulfide isomerase
MPLPIHKDAVAAHRAAVAADNQGQFWAMFELLYADQEARTTAELEAMAKQLGLKLKQFRSDLADPQTDALVEQQREFCEKQLDSRGTPSFFINGRPLTGAQPIDAFEAIIAEELASKP